jgi:UDP-2-acetamido-2,6-beta-L-arabino-hexul-4-ose reductase
MNKTLRIGITGQDGFIGTHLYNFLRVQTDVERIPFLKEYFQDESRLRNFVSQCDVIVHLAGMSRNDDMQLLYDANIELVRKLIDAMDAERVKPHVLFGSTTHEPRGNIYHQSKRDGRIMFDEWAERNGAAATGLMMPNTFGPYGKPEFNSFVSTFCWKVANGERPQIMVDASVELIYIDDLCREIFKAIRGECTDNPYYIKHTFDPKVSVVLHKLEEFKYCIDKEEFPCLKDTFDLALFNTFKSYC